ncbi:MAG: phosphoglycerate kinase, partial [Bacteriovoracaceae bacterium]|nr:phosphoglycerate kinase [Bacteriovoracaceae bacterium]
MALQYIDQADIQGKRILARFDFNVPLDGATITDSSRIDMALPTIKYILDKGVSQLILISHLGRPKGKSEAKYSLEPVAKYLAEQLKEDVLLTESALDEGIRTLQQLKKNKIILLENIRFHSEEEQNDFEFAKKIASYADLYV